MVWFSYLFDFMNYEFTIYIVRSFKFPTFLGNDISLNAV